MAGTETARFQAQQILVKDNLKPAHSMTLLLEKERENKG